MTNQASEEQAAIEEIVSEYKKKVFDLTQDRDKRLKELVEQAKKAKLARLSEKFKK